MAQYSNLKAYIEEKIYENGTQAITGDILQDVLKVMTDDLGEFYQTGGVASPSTDPGTPDAKVIYFATEAGTYTNFGNIELAAGEVALLIFDTSWVKETLNVLSSANGGVKTANLADGAVTTAKIANGAVEEGKIADASVTSGKLGSGAVTTEKIADGAATTDKIANKAVATGKLGDKAVTTGKIADSAVGTTQVANEAITEGKIADEAVTAGKIADGAVTNGKINDGAVTEGKIGSGAVTTGKIGAKAVTTGKIADKAVTSGQLGDKAVTSDKIADGAVGSDQLAEGAFSAQNLADGSVTTDKLADDAVTAEKIADGAVTAGKFANGSVTTIKLGSGAVTTEKIGDGMVTRQKLADSSVGTSKIIDGAVTTDKVADGAITDAKLENPVSVSQNTLSIGGNYAGEMSTTYDVTLHSGQTFASLSALLSDANLNTLIPLVVRKGGMSIKFVCSSDNKYVKYMYKLTDTATVAKFKHAPNWEKTNLEVEISQLDKKVNELKLEDLVLANGDINQSTGAVTTSKYRLYTSPIYGTRTISVPSVWKISRVYYYAFDGTYDSTIYINNQTATFGKSDCYAVLTIWIDSSTEVKPQDLKASIVLEQLTESANASKNLFIPNAPANAQRAVKELYLTGLAAPENYYIGEVRTNGTNKVRVYIRKASDDLLVAYSEYTQSVGEVSVIIPSNSSGISGYAVVNLGTNAVITMDATAGLIDKLYVGNLENSPSIKTMLAKSEITAETDAKLLEYAKKDEVDRDAGQVSYALQKTNYVAIEAGGISAADGTETDSDTNLRTDFIPINVTSFESGVYDNVTSTKLSINKRFYGSNKNYLGSSSSLASSASYVRLTFDNGQAFGDDFTIILNGLEYQTREYAETAQKANAGLLNVEVADGRLAAYGSELSEVEASPIVDNSGDSYVGYSVKEKQNDYPIYGDIVAINHDDIAASDYIGTRKIYNKYGHNVDYCFILNPFESFAERIRRTKGMKQMYKEGHHIGLHAILNCSYWRENPFYDVRPDGSTTFAPTRTELRGPNLDGTGDNAFGKTITASTKVSSMYVDALSFATMNVVELTEAQVNALDAEYTFYGASERTQYGGAFANGSYLQARHIVWLEQWYNGLIDNTLGYSSTESTIAARFAEDYDYPSGSSAADYYPDATHLLNGKMVYYGDTSNPHYNDASYQKVGKFTKGLFKGCFSCCNYEVMDRCIEIAIAFVRHYFGIDGFHDAHRHGVGYTDLHYYDGGVYYWERSKTIPYSANGRFFLSRLGAWSSQIKVFEKFGMVQNVGATGRYALSALGQIGMYYGQDGIRQPYVSSTLHKKLGGVAWYLNLFGSNETETMSYATYAQFVNGIEDQIKYFYDNAGQSVTRNGLTKTIFSGLKDAIDAICSARGTGKIPCLAWDTINVNPAEMQAVELLERYLKSVGITPVPFDVAQKIAIERKRDASGNVFPNPAFNQMNKFIGGASNDLLIPDGWMKDTKSATASVVTETIDGNNERVFRMEASSNNSAIFSTAIFGLPQGKYRLKFNAQSSNGEVRVYILTNSSPIELSSSDAATTMTLPTSYGESVYEFDIPAPYRNDDDPTDAMNQICGGYEDNVCCIKVELVTYTGNVTKIFAPSLLKIG